MLTDSYTITLNFIEDLSGTSRRGVWLGQFTVPDVSLVLT